MRTKKILLTIIAICTTLTMTCNTMAASSLTDLQKNQLASICTGYLNTYGDGQKKALSHAEAIKAAPILRACLEQVGCNTGNLARVPNCQKQLFSLYIQSNGLAQQTEPLPKSTTPPAPATTPVPSANTYTLPTTLPQTETTQPEQPLSRPEPPKKQESEPSINWF